MIKNPPSLKLNSFHYPNLPKSKPAASSPYEKILQEESSNDTILKTQNKVSDIKRNLSDVFNNISTKTKGSQKSRPIDEMDADYLFENFEEIFEVHQNSQNSEDLYSQLQKAQSNSYIIKNLARVFEEAANIEPRRTEEILIENQKKKSLIEKKIEEDSRKPLNTSVYDGPKSKIMASNEYYKNFLTKLTENHCEGCSCLNCKVFEVVTQNKRPLKYGYEEYHKRMKTEIFQIRDEEIENNDEEKIFQQPTTSNNMDDASMIIHTRQKSIQHNNNNKKMNESFKGKNNNEIENNSFYSNSIDMGNKQENEKNDSNNRNRNSKNGEKRIFYKRKVGLPPLNKKNQSIYPANLFYKPTTNTNNNGIKRSISTGIPKRLI